MNKPARDDLWVYIVRTSFILVILLVAIFSGCYSGIFETSSPITTPIATMPPETTSGTLPEDTTTATTTSQTTTETTIPTETTSDTTSDTVDTEETTYPPVTFPTDSSHQQVEIPSGITFDDITDEAMSELIEEKFLTLRDNSRSGEKLKSVKNIVVHYVGNPNTPAINNWSYFEHQTSLSVSAHFIIGLEGEIIQCMPLDEVAWAVGDLEGNYTSISIECCHPDETGYFTKETYKSLVKLTSWLCNTFELGRDDVLRHYDYKGKHCPKYFVANPFEWEAFKESLLIK